MGLLKIKTQHEKFAMDARRSPGPVFGDHASAISSCGLAIALWKSAPVQTETSPVPSDNCLRRDDDQ
jgi:hypothetical protein